MALRFFKETERSEQLWKKGGRFRRQVIIRCET